MEAFDRQVVIEHAVRRDMEAVLDLWTALMRMTEMFHARYELVSGARALQHKYLMSFLDSTNAALFVARAGREIVGFVNVYTTRPSQVFRQEQIGILENIYIEPEYRKFGIGRSLVERATAFMSRLKVTDFYVNVIPANRGSEAFWRRMGYETSKITMSRHVEG